MRSTLALVLVIGSWGCTGDDTSMPAEQPLYPANYAATFTEVRNCRFSTDHDSQRIRVLASPDALETYNTRTGTFATGALLVKEQYAMADTTCSGDIQQVTVMQKLPAGSDPANLDWSWQRVFGDTVSPESIQRCVSCHADCGVAPVGFDGTCTMP